MKEMKSVHFDSYKEFAQVVVDNMRYVETAIEIICFYDCAKELVRELVLTNKCEIVYMELKDQEYSGYDREFYIMVSKYVDGDKFEISCETAMCNGKYKYSEADITYVLDDCHTSVLPNIDSAIVYETSVCDEDCEITTVTANADTTENIHMDDDMNGFTISTSDEHGYSSFSFHSTDRGLVTQMLQRYKNK